MPVDHLVETHEDGSVTLLVGDVDQMYGTKVLTSFTLYPGKAYIEIRGQLYNRTPLPQTFLWWANPAVSVNEYTQSIFPPDVHTVYDHGKRAVSRFPIAKGEYYKHDYSEGVDMLYKKLGVPFVERLKQYEAQEALIRERDDAMLEWVTLYNLNGEPQKAYDLIMSHSFRP